MRLLKYNGRFDREIIRPGEIELHAVNERYTLEYKQSIPLRFRFKDRTQIDMGVSITGRDLQSRTSTSYSPYLEPIVRRKVQGRMFIEVGAGLGEFAYRMAPGIIVIDPAKYDLMLEMLEDIKPDVKLRDKKRYNTMVKRCQTILDPTKVQLIPTTVEEAVETRSDLHGIADIVVDNLGALEWSRTVGFMNGESPSFADVVNFEIKLLKPTGVLFCDDHNLLIDAEGQPYLIEPKLLRAALPWTHP